MASSTTTMEEKYQMIMECRRSGLTDKQWCEEHGVNVSTFYNWLSRFRKKDGYEVPESLAPKTARPKQEVVRIDMVPAQNSKLPVLSQTEFAENEIVPSIEISMKHVKIAVRNTADTFLLEQTLKLLKELSC